jgi:hypothetical protein
MSVHQRLLKRSASHHEDFQRLLARLAASVHRDRFVLKKCRKFEKSP